MVYESPRATYRSADASSPVVDAAPGAALRPQPEPMAASTASVMARSRITFGYPSEACSAPRRSDRPPRGARAGSLHDRRAVAVVGRGSIDPRVVVGVRRRRAISAGRAGGLGDPSRQRGSGCPTPRSRGSRWRSRPTTAGSGWPAACRRSARPLTEVEIFDPASGEWIDGPALPASVHHAALVSDGDRLLLIGGYLGSAFNRPTDIVLALDDEDAEWVPGPTLPAPRAAGAAAWDGARVVYAGGVGGRGERRRLRAGRRRAGSAIGAMAEPREHLAATSDLAGRTWLLGGRVGGLTANLADGRAGGGRLDHSCSAACRPRAAGSAAFHVEARGVPDRRRGARSGVHDGGVHGRGRDGHDRCPSSWSLHHGHGAAVVDGVAYVLLGGPRARALPAPPSRRWRSTRSAPDRPMFLTGTLLNVATVLAGTLIGLAPRRADVRADAGEPDDRPRPVHVLIALSMGLRILTDPAARPGDDLAVLAAVLVGVVDRRAPSPPRRARVARWLVPAPAGRATSGPSRIAEGFVTASLVFCVGPLTILGSLENGLTGDVRLLAIKSMLDGVAASPSRPRWARASRSLPSPCWSCRAASRAPRSCCAT